MAYLAIQTKGAYTNFIIRPDEIRETLDLVHPVTEPSSPWVLGLINITNERYAYASLGGGDGHFGKWFKIPETGTNCSTNFEECSRQGNWTVILKVSGNSPAFDIRIATRPDELGNATGTEFLGVKPDTSCEGGLIGIS